MSKFRDGLIQLVSRGDHDDEGKLEALVWLLRQVPDEIEDWPSKKNYGPRAEWNACLEAIISLIEEPSTIQGVTHHIVVLDDGVDRKIEGDDI